MAPSRKGPLSLVPSSQDRTSGSSPPQHAHDSGQARQAGGLRQLMTVRLPRRLSLRAASLLSISALFAWGLTGWFFLDAKPYLIAVFLVGTAFTLAYMIIMHPLADRGNGEQAQLKRAPGQVINTAIVLLISSVIVYLLYNRGGLIRQFFDWLGQQLHLLVDGERVVAIGLHVWFLGIFFAFSVPHWIRYARRGTRHGLSGPLPQRHVTTSELIARDLVAGSVLLGVLALICQVGVYGALVGAFGRALNISPPEVSTWTVSWYLGDKASFSTLDRLTTTLLTITVTDLIAALTLFAVGGVMVALVEINWLLARGMSLGEVVWKIISGIISPWAQIAALFQNVVVRARRAIWPMLIFVAVLCLSVVADFVKRYLTDLRNLHAPGGFNAWIDLGLPNLLIIAVLTSAAALLVLAAVIVQFFRRENLASLVGAMPAYWLPELLRIGLVVVFCTGLISVTLSAIDGLVTFVQNVVLQSPGGVNHPFFPLGLVTYFALVEFLFIAVITFRDRGRHEVEGEQEQGR